MTFNIKLNPPKSKHSRAKLTAYKRYWQGVVSVRNELSIARIHHGVTIGQLADHAQIGYATAKRFYEFGKGHGKLTYSYFHGPAATTVFGIADALGLQVQFKRKNGRANGKG